MTVVKICGVRTPDIAHAALDAGADMLGLVFAASRRQVTPAAAQAISEAVRGHPRGPLVRLVGVFVDRAVAEIRDLVQHCDLDVVQLSGHESLATARDLAPLTIMRAVRLAGDADEAEWLGIDDHTARLLIDAHVPGSYGGAGIVADWPAAARLARRRGVVLAGGLSPENVADAIRAVRPWGVDVSSGVEYDGVKSATRIAAFVRAVRDADVTPVA
ncbi:MAG: phosphoribosylanthranilate isomerase [Chloroflexi bacterium]|nr:phosphoribosylanthranilate isomerase [Chloroflexota bacterium]